MKKSIIVAVFAFMLVLPATTYQVFRGGILTVYKGADAQSGVYYSGIASGYDGRATADLVIPFIPGVSILGTSTPIVQ